MSTNTFPMAMAPWTSRDRSNPGENRATKVRERIDLDHDGTSFRSKEDTEGAIL